MLYLQKIEFLLKENCPDGSTLTPGAGSCSPDTADGVLYITDIGSLSSRLISAKLPVLGWVHEGNRKENFGGCRYFCEDLQELDLKYLERIYRRYKHIPWDILETSRCLLRETTVEDVDSFYQIYASPSITCFMEPLFTDPQEERIYTQNYIEKVYGFYEIGIWTVLHKESGRIIGRAGLSFREGYEDPELGFMIAEDYQGRGIATEVCQAILEYGREHFAFTKFLAFVHPENSASLRVCEKLGNQLEIIPIR